VPKGHQLEVSEIFVSIQGEGASAGQPCVFLRLAGCNLRCGWCDTKYTWDFTTYDRGREVTTQSVEAVARRLEGCGSRRLVVTGGEPLLQQSALGALLAELDSTWLVEVETNGTVVPNVALLARVDQWNVSPKLGNSGEPATRRLVWPVLAALRATNRAWLKLVVDDPTDLEEARDLVGKAAWPERRVLLMPQGATVAALRQRDGWVTRASARHGYGVSPRLHVERWGGARGR
jgi:organic radical activating enzyme